MSDYYENLCPFCENNLLLTYFCSDCTAVFCENCVQYALNDELICTNCGSKEISMVNMAALECKQCKSNHITSIQKKLHTCPNCSSGNVVKIITKFDELRNRFKNIITTSKRFLSPLVYAVDTISIQKEKLIRLREDSVQMCHFPRLEMEIIQSVKLFKDGKHTVQLKTSDFFQHINRNFKTYFDIEKSPPKLIPVLEAELESLEKSAESIISYGNSANEKLEEKFVEIRTKLDFMSSVQSLFMRYLSLLSNNMEYHEKPVFGIRGKLGDSNQPETDHFSKTGTILLTNRKLYFLHEKGFVKKHTEVLLALPLEELTRVRLKGFILKKLLLEFGPKKFLFHLGKKNLAQLENYIEKARVFDNNKIDRDLLFGLKHVDVGIQEFRNALESAIISLIGYKTAILDSDDPFGIEMNQFTNTNPSSEQHHTPPQEYPYPVDTIPNPQNQFSAHSTYSPPVQCQDPGENQQRENLTSLYNYYQKRPMLNQTKAMAPPPTPPPSFHKNGTISNPYNPPSTYDPSYTQYSHSHIAPNTTQSRFPLKTPTSSIVNKVLSVLPDESPHIPQPPEVIHSHQQVPEIDVSKLIPEQDFPEKLLRLEEQTSWLQRKLDMLMKARDQGKLSETDFFRLYEEAHKELYRTQKYIQQIKERSKSF